MRRALIALMALTTVGGMAVADAAAAQSSQRDRDRQQEQVEEQSRQRQRGPAPLNRRANAGPCPYVKILYDAARYVELANNQAATANVGFTGEIEGVSADCTYREADPITVDMNLLFRLGRGPQAQGDQRTYRYWIAVTERNRAVLDKVYIDLPVNFAGSATAEAEDSRTIVIPRRDINVSGSNFEILIGFDVTPEMAEFNRSGSRFRINAGAPAATPTQ